MESDLLVAQSYGKSEASQVFAGVERGSDDTLLVGFTDDAENHLRELAGRLEVPSRLRAFPARWTLGELEEMQADTDEDMSSFVFERDGFCVSSSSLEIAENAVVWEIFATDPKAARRRLHERYGDALRVVVLGGSDAVTEPAECYGYRLVHPTVLRLHYSDLSSSTLAGVQVEERDEQVRVTVLVHAYLGATRLQVRAAHVDTTLAVPLGERKVVDTASEKELRRL
jgi:hypothetical protein